MSQLFEAAKYVGRLVLERKRKQRRAAQLIEEALLLSVALVALSLLVGGIDSVLNQAGGLTSGVWTSISGTLSSLFGSAFHWVIAPVETMRSFFLGA